MSCRCILEQKNWMNLKLKLKIQYYIFKTFWIFDYINLQFNALAIISDSGTITEESSLICRQLLLECMKARRNG